MIFKGSFQPQPFWDSVVLWFWHTFNGHNANILHVLQHAPKETYLISNVPLFSNTKAGPV